ncbi:hypothetical protein F4782DRAFT_503566 [Xylaria castorea]|nr:hypothetical protein F4782DRAFT_503566 [Xylaria castorea]
MVIFLYPSLLNRSSHSLFQPPFYSARATEYKEMRPRLSPYSRVEVRGLFWEGHNHQRQHGPVRNADQELLSRTWCKGQSQKLSVA